MERAILPVLSILLLFCSYPSFSLNFEELACGCMLEPTLETKKQFNEIIDETTTFVYLRLNFLNTTFNSTEFAYLKNTFDVIDPLLWVLAVGKNGKELLRSSFDFIHMSLGSLGAYGIKSLNLDIINSQCFTSDIPDDEKLCAIVNMLNRLSINAVNFLHGKKGDMVFQLENVNICLEKQSGDRRFVVTDTGRTETLVHRLSESGHGVLQFTAQYSCLPVNDIMISTIIPRGRQHWWLPWLLNAVVILVILFSPYIFFAFFDWEKPPRNGKIRLDTRPYPFGFFHFVFYSTFVKSGCAYNLCSLSCCLRHIFFSIFMIFLCCLQFIPYLYVHRKNYTLRQMAAERMGVWKFDGRNVALTYISIAVLLVNIILFNVLKFYIRRLEFNKGNPKRTNVNFKKIGKSYITAELIFTEAADKDIIAIICPKFRGNVFEHTPKVHDIWNIILVLKMLHNGKKSRIVKILLTPITVAYWIGQSIPLIYYTNVVLAVILSLVHNKFSNKKKAGFDDENIALRQKGRVEESSKAGSSNRMQQTVEDVVLLYLQLVPFCFVFAFVTIPVFFQLFVTCSFLADVLGYTFIGVLVNAKYVVPELVIVLGVAWFLVQTVTGYSDTYANLFYKIIKLSEAQNSKALSHDTDGVPQIDLKFFFRIAYQVKPWKRGLFFVYLQLVSAGIFFILGYWLLQYVTGFKDLEGLSQLLGAVVIGGLLPIAKLIAEPPATVKCKDKAEKRQLQQLILMFEETKENCGIEHVEDPAKSSVEIGEVSVENVI